MSKFRMDVRNGKGHLKLTLLGTYAKGLFVELIESEAIKPEYVNFKDEKDVLIYRTVVQQNVGRNNVFEFDLLENSYLRITKQ